MSSENKPSPQELLQIASENRSVNRTEIGIEAKSSDNQVTHSGHIRGQFTYDGDDKKSSEGKESK